MIICICRRISDRHISACIADGARTAGAIFQSQGCRPQCGQCVPFLKGMIGDIAGTAEGGDPIGEMA